LDGCGTPDVDRRRHGTVVNLFVGRDRGVAHTRITRVMKLGLRVAFAAAVAVFAAAAPAQGAAGRLVAFRSCPDLVTYAKTNAARFVGPYGLGGTVGIKKVGPGAVTPMAAADSAAAPQQGVDYSGTNVQETGVDEPDLAKTNGNTTF